MKNYLPHKKALVVLAVVFGLISYGRDAYAVSLTPVRFELEGNPGTVVSEEMVLTNETDSPETYYSSFANFEAQGESGSPSFVNPVEGLGTWMTTTSSVTLLPGQSQIVPFSVSVPSDAEPGGNFGAIFWSTTPSEVGENGAVTIGAKTGVLVLLSINGEVKEAGGILDFATKDSKKFHTSLPVNFTYRFRNDGGDRIKPNGDVLIRNLFGFLSARVPANQVEGNVLPNQTRKFEALWQSKNANLHSNIKEDEQVSFWKHVTNEWHHFAFGYYGATLSLEYGSALTAVSPTVHFWVFPWHLLLVVVVTLVVAIIVFRKLLRRYNRWIISQVETRIKAEQAVVTKNTKV
jgi:hypothetical protein